MITTHRTMDSHALEIRREGKWIGDILWHPEREPRIILREASEHLTLSEIESAISAYKAAHGS